MTEAATAVGWYVYAVVEAGADTSAAGVRRLEHGGLAALVEEVDPRDFEPAALEERAGADWLAERVLAHEAVLQRAASRATVLPFRFGAVYSRAEDVVALLDRRGEELSTALERLRGHVELGVKAWVDRRRYEGSLAGPSGDEGEEASSGRGYLLRRQGERRRSAEATERLGELARGLHDRLSRAAVAAVANPPQPRQLTGRTEQMLLNGAYLVRHGHEALAREVDAIAAEHAHEGLTLELTGPWPPHNFVDPGEGAS